MARILVVDDEDTIKNLIRQYLELEGFEVFEASNGQEAIELQRKIAAEVMFIDMIMPEKERIETIMEIRRTLLGNKNNCDIWCRTR